MNQGILIEESDRATQASEAQGKLVVCGVNELRPHPSFDRHGLSVPIADISVLGSDVDQRLREPLMITQERIILRGYAQWELARLHGQVTVTCIEYNIGDEEALRCLLQSHRRSNGLNDFARILLALDLEPWLQEKARCNQRAGGQNKGSSTLATACRVDVRCEIAAAAGVSTGNVTKVKQLVQTACPDLLQALRRREVSIHRAWQWSQESPQEQRQRLFRQRGEAGVRATIRQLLSQHRPERARPLLAITDLLRFLREVDTNNSNLIQVAVVEAPGTFIFVTEELCRSIKA